MAINATATSNPYYVMRFGPVQSLLDKERYAASHRFAKDIMSLVRSSAFGPEIVKRLDNCVWRNAYGPK